MFANDLDAPLVEDPSLVKMKIKSRVFDHYSKLGEIPGVLVDKISRDKILKELGHQANTAVDLAAEEQQETRQEETKKTAELSMVT